MRSATSSCTSSLRRAARLDTLEARRLLSQATELDAAFGAAGVASPARQIAASIPAQHADDSVAIDFTDLGPLPDGRVVMVADVTEYDAYGENPTPRGMVVARLDPQGRLDRAFGGGDGWATFELAAALRVQNVAIGGVTAAPGGKVVLGVRGLTHIAVARLNADGSLDHTFGGDGFAEADFHVDEQPTDVAVQTDGKVLVAGGRTAVGVAGLSVVRFNADGSIDRSFGSSGRFTSEQFTAAGLEPDPYPGGPQYPAARLALLSSGKILVNGQQDLGRTAAFVNVARLNANGVLDTTYADDGVVNLLIASPTDDVPYDADWSVRPDGGVFLSATLDVNSESLSLWKLKPDGTADRSFDGDGKLTFRPRTTPNDDRIQRYRIGATSSGKLLIVGTEGARLASAIALLARLNADGSADTSLTPLGDLRMQFADMASVGLAHVTSTGDGRIQIIQDGNVVRMRGEYQPPAGVTLDASGLLTISGTTGADTINVGTSGTGGANVTATLNGTTRTYARSSIKQIVVYGNVGNDRITIGDGLPVSVGASGDAGNDTVTSGAGADNILGGSGNDRLVAGAGDDTVGGGPGDDIADYSARTSSLVGQLGYDTDLMRPFGSVSAGGESDALWSVERLLSGRGDDTLNVLRRGQSYSDVGLWAPFRFAIDGGPGNDDLSVGYMEYAEAALEGGDGNDHLQVGGSYQTNSSDGGPGDDYCDVSDDDVGPSSASGGPGYDTLYYSSRDHTVYGDRFEHMIVENAYDVEGDDGDQLIEVGGAEIIHGGGGNDHVIVADFGDVFGDDGNDVIEYGGTYSKANLDGGNGNDLIFGGAVTDDVIHGGKGNDTLNGGGGRDALFGGDGNDFLQGAAGDDFLSGESGDDTLAGGAGNDLLDGGSGADDLFGGKGKDTADYHFRSDNLVLTMDGLANDGGSGGGEHDNIRGDIENVTGGGGRDRIVGDDLANVLRGNGGNDTIYGNGGNDAITPGAGRDHVYAGAGDDRILCRDGVVDSVDGGAGADTVTRDNAAGVVDLVLSVEELH
jgi:uncharacterized delta-60 repeat protein